MSLKMTASHPHTFFPRYDRTTKTKTITKKIVRVGVRMFVAVLGIKQYVAVSKLRQAFKLVENGPEHDRTI